jgi:hypothetical protein
MPGDETGMDIEVVTESAAVQVAGSRTSRRGQIVFNLDADRSETMDLDPDPTRVGPGAGVGTHIAAGGMAGASLSAYSGRQQDSGPGPGGGAHGYPDRQPGDCDERQVHPVASAPEAVTDTTPPRQSGDGRGGDRAGGVDVEAMQSLTQHRHARAAATDTTSPRQSRGGGGWGRAGGVDVEEPAVTSADVPLQDVTVSTGMFPATMELERPQVQSQPTHQSAGAEMCLQIDLDTSRQRPDDDTALETDTARDAAGLPRKKKNRRLSGKPSRGRKTKY